MLNRKVQALVGFGLLSIGLLSNQALADNTQVKLSYSAQELSSVAGVKTVHERIRRIARDACPSYGVSRELASNRECVQDIESQLVRRVNHAGLTARYSGQKLPDLASVAIPQRDAR